MLPGPAVGFLNRQTECEELDRLLALTRDGRSAALVLRGEAGIGKTALLQHAARRAVGSRIAEVTGVQAEMELPFAGLHQLCAPMLDHFDALPRPQGDALRVALGLAAGNAPDRFLVSLATLSLLSEVANERPLLCLVDDAQWLDLATAEILAFVARRLSAESVALVLAIREPAEADRLRGLPELMVRGLRRDEAIALLASAVPGRLDARVRDRVVAETGGNPLALLELPRGMSAAELAGGFDTPLMTSLPGRLEEHYRRRIEQLPEDTQRLLLVAAADPVGDAALVLRAGQTLAIAPDALAPAAAAALLEIGAVVRFRHPLVRSAVYRAAPVGDRRRAHAALAQVSDPERDADRWAWHRALAASAPDEGVAAELERAAGRAEMRGGLAAAVAFLERAASLTPEAAPRARRELAAAQAKHQAGAPEAALALLATAEGGPLDEIQRARAELLRAQITFTTNRGRDAPALLLKAAKQLEQLEPALARETYLEALMASQVAGRSAPGAVVQVAQAARAAPASPTSRGLDVLLDGMAVMITEGHGPAVPLLRAAVDAFRHGDLIADGSFRWLWLAEAAAQEIWDLEAWHELAELQLRVVRDTGALTMLPLAIHAVICARIYAGELAAAAALIDDQKNATEATGSQLAPYGALILAAWRGSEAELTALIGPTLDEIVARGEGIGVSACQWVSSVMHNSLGQYESALAAAQQVIDPPRKLDWTINATLPELIEAASRSGHTELAYDGLEQLVALTRPSGSEWGLGLEARCQALLSPPEAAEPFYRDAIERLSRSRVIGEHARAHLLYGEWLRRQGRRLDAREQLRTAHQMFSETGMEAFAERTRRELAATGVKARKRSADTRDELTSQEMQIARLARDGLSNPEIGARLFLSRRTVEWHLHKVFGKLGITSRTALRDALPEDSFPSP
jgi:DNA-binding CsgD family transcriptional regulator